MSTEEKQSLQVEEEKWITKVKTIKNNYIKKNNRFFNDSRSEKYGPEYLLNENYEKISNINGLKTNLYLHQKTIIRAMIDLENNRLFTLNVLDVHCKNNNIEEIVMQKNNYVRTNAGILSEPVGSGKTIDILSVILYQKIPKVYKSIETDIKQVSFSDIDINAFIKAPILFKKFKKILTPTIIIVGVSVIDQWINAIKKFTDLKFIAVCNIKDLDNLLKMIASNKINRYDIVLIKNGKVTRYPIDIPEIGIEKKECLHELYIYNIFSSLETFCWARVVIDDFDTIKMPPHAVTLNGLFTWYISSTRKSYPAPYEHNITDAKYTSDLFLKNHSKCSSIINNKILFNNLNLRNDPLFIKKSNNLKNPKFYAYVFKNKNNKIIQALGGMQSEEVNAIMEMLNSDAIESAANQAGISTTNVIDIFEKILGKQYNILKESIIIIGFIDKQIESQLDWKSLNLNPDEEDLSYTKHDLLNFKPIHYKYPNILKNLEIYKNEYINLKISSSKAIERVRTNLQTGECPICISDLNDDEEDILIFKCCNVVICGTCTFGTIFPQGKLNGNCSNCRAQINIKELVYLNNINFNYDDLLESLKHENFNELLEEQEVKESVIKNKPTVVRTKIHAIIDICNGIIPEEQKPIRVHINNLMNSGGDETISDIPIKITKVLIFANFDETLDKLCQEFRKINIRYLKLGGTHRQISDIATEFNNSLKSEILVVNSIKHCSGLNLQSATDLIFIHRIIDQSIQTQVIGRIQRLGRTGTAKIHYMLYDNEYESLKHSNDMVEL